MRTPSTPRRDVSIAATPAKTEDSPCVAAFGSPSTASPFVSVAVRVKPAASGSPIVVRAAPPGSVEGQRRRIIVNRGCVQEEHEFSRVFAPEDDNWQLFQGLHGPALVESVFDGVNETLFAYGQTGSGKTHTIFGKEEDFGLLQYFVQETFDRAAQLPGATVHVCCYEVFGDTLTDLLDAGPLLSEGEVLPQDIIHDELFLKTQKFRYQVIHVGNMAACLDLLQAARGHRATGTSSNNISSSRSHAIVHLFVQCSRPAAVNDGFAPQSSPAGGADASGGGISIAALTLVDLAGAEKEHENPSEHGRKSTRVLNNSLSSLNRLLRKLQTNTLFESERRQSVLNKCLWEYLRPGCGIALIFCISPLAAHRDFTFSTLSMARDSKLIHSRRRSQLIEASAASPPSTGVPSPSAPGKAVPSFSAPSVGLADFAAAAGAASKAADVAVSAAHTAFALRRCVCGGVDEFDHQPQQQTRPQPYSRHSLQALQQQPSGLHSQASSPSASPRSKGGSGASAHSSVVVAASAGAATTVASAPLPQSVAAPAIAAARAASAAANAAAAVASAAVAAAADASGLSPEEVASAAEHHGVCKDFFRSISRNFDGCAGVAAVSVGSSPTTCANTPSAQLSPARGPRLGRWARHDRLMEIIKKSSALKADAAAGPDGSGGSAGGGASSSSSCSSSASSPRARRRGSSVGMLSSTCGRGAEGRGQREGVIAQDATAAPVPARAAAGGVRGAGCHARASSQTTASCRSAACMDAGSGETNAPSTPDCLQDDRANLHEENQLLRRECEHLRALFVRQQRQQIAFWGGPCMEMAATTPPPEEEETEEAVVGEVATKEVEVPVVPMPSALAAESARQGWGRRLREERDYWRTVAGDFKRELNSLRIETGRTSLKDPSARDGCQNRIGCPSVRRAAWSDCASDMSTRSTAAQSSSGTLEAA